MFSCTVVCNSLIYQRAAEVINMPQLSGHQI